MKNIFIFIFSFLLLFIFFIPSFAESFSAYGSITPSTSQISALIDSMYNQSDFDPFKDFIGIRTGDYDYSIFYNIENGSAQRLRYYGVVQGYSTTWYFSKSDISNFSYDRGNYSIIGNTDDSLGIPSYYTFYHTFIISISVLLLTITFLFFVFRIRKGKGSLDI